MSQKLHFIVKGTEIVESRMSSDTIVKAHAVTKDFSSCQFHGSKDMIGTLAFECCPEALHGGIIMAVARATHANGNAIIQQHLLVG